MSNWRWAVVLSKTEPWKNTESIYLTTSHSLLTSKPMKYRKNMNKPILHITVLLLIVLLIAPVAANQTQEIHYPLENIQISPGYPDIPDDNQTLTDITDEIHHPVDDLRTYLVTAYSRQYGLPPVFVTELIALFLILLTSGAVALLYTRDRPRSDKTHGKILHLLDTVEKNPGTTFSELRTLTGYSRNSLIRTLHLLEHDEKLLTIISSGTTHYYPITETLNPDEERMRLIIAGENPHQIFRTIMDHPGITQKQLIETTGIPRTTCQWHLSSLLDEQVIAKEIHKNTTCYTALPAYIQLYRIITQKNISEPAGNDD